jgi:penicillin-binding protein 2
MAKKIVQLKDYSGLSQRLSRSLFDNSSTGFIPRDRRAKLLFGFLALIIILLVGRLIFLQVVKSTHYSRISEQNRIRPWILPASRGVVTDRNGKSIATNRPSYTVSLIPYEVSKALPQERSDHVKGTLSPLVENLATCLDLDAGPLMEKVRANWQKGYEPIKLKKDVDFNTICVIAERNEDLPGVDYQVEPARKYLEAGWVGHVLGYVNEVTREEISGDSIQGGLRRGAVIGRKGIEKQYDQILRGKDGVTFLEVTARGKILGPLEEKKPDPPINGSDARLTIDIDLQAEAESALADHPSGAVVAIDPQNGEVLCLMSKPGLDANLFAGAMSPEEWNQILNNPLHPLLTRPIQATYPPGSTLKLLTAAIALEEDIANKYTFQSICRGSFQFGTRRYGCWEPEGHGRLNLVGAIIQSCDVYFYQLGLKVGLQRWSHYAQMCGFGKKSGIDIPDEAKGLVPTLEYYHKRYGKGNWVKNLVINLSIGQGEILVTPLQMAVFFGGLATDGRIPKPFLWKEAVTSDGRIISTQPEIKGHLPFSSSTLNILKEAMIGAVNDPEGTGILAKLPDIQVAGKTGTAQNPHGEDHAWFVGYAPASDPQIVVVVLVENIGHGGTFAAPVAKRIIERYLRKDLVQTQKDNQKVTDRQNSGEQMAADN